ncbi:hypothetical protein [Weissella confusa]|nr:hypothetical protein [Weissella confusa]MDY2511641.1 hypothetical protein [Weissella confusa]
MSNDVWEDLNKSMSKAETRSMPRNSHEETPEDYQNLFDRLKKDAESKKN